MHTAAGSITKTPGIFRGRGMHSRHAHSCVGYRQLSPIGSDGRANLGRVSVVGGGGLGSGVCVRGEARG